MSIGIYFAGKIGHTDWRHELVERATGQSRILRDSDGPFEFSMGRHQVTYQGPFFCSCDHGCFHGPHTHGVGLDIHVGCPAARSPHDVFADGGAVYFESLAAIDRSEWVFAFINDPTCFGTLFELGYARARGKALILCFSEKRLDRDMWFISQGPLTASAVNADPYDELLDTLDRAFPQGYAALLASPLWQKRRLEIMQRDRWACTRCGSRIRQLHVHHKCYVPGRKPWEYSDDQLTTLCADCHKGTHSR
jgi:hypothetical protein